MEHTCPLCDRSRWHVLWENKTLFVIDAAEKDWPGFIRVIAKSHTKEMSDFALEERHHLYDVVNSRSDLKRLFLSNGAAGLNERSRVVPVQQLQPEGLVFRQILKDEIHHTSGFPKPVGNFDSLHVGRPFAG